MTAPDQQPTPDERLRRLEEHAGFAEHTVDQLSDEIAEMNRRIVAAIKRLETLERRIDALVEPERDTPGA